MQEHIRREFERVQDLLTRSPDRGRDTATTEVTLTDGLSCSIREGAWTLAADMPDNAGGTGSAPTPGVYGRAALGSCMAIGYAMWAAKLGVSLTDIRVAIEADFDSGALFGVADVPAGYSEVRCTVSVTSDASEKEVLRVLDEADRHSPYVDVFTRAQKLERSLRLFTASV